MSGPEVAMRVESSSSEDIKGWNLTSVNITPAENGFVVSRSYERPQPKRGGKSQFPSWDDTHMTKTAVFETKDSMDEFVDRTFGIKD